MWECEGNWSTWGSEPQPGKVAPAHPVKDISALLFSVQKSTFLGTFLDTDQDPYAPRHLVEEPSLIKGIKTVRRAGGDLVFFVLFFFYIYIYIYIDI